MRSPADPASEGTAEGGVALHRPTLHDGREMWRMARDSKVLDVNAPYAYLLWCRDFAGTSVLATVDGRPAGFVTGYSRPDRPDVLMVWQVAVDAEHRGRGLAGRMLHHLAERLRPAALETTITADNEASIALFAGFAREHGAEVLREPLFDAALFPDGHEAELLFRIGPLRRTA